MKPVYDIEGLETEAGVEATIPIEAPTGEEAVRRASAEGLERARVVGVHQAHPSDASARSSDPERMSAGELVDKSGPVLRPRILVGWLLLLFAVPAAVLGCSVLGNLFGLPLPIVIGMEVVAVVVIVGLAIQSFRRFWS